MVKFVDVDVVVEKRALRTLSATYYASCFVFASLQLPT